jgi:hypothetical protein
MVAILPHVDRDGADPNTIAFKPRTSHDEHDGDDHVEESRSTDSDDSMVPRPRLRATANTVPYNPYGLVFLRTIRVGDRYPVPRLQRSDLLRFQMLSPHAFQNIFNTTRDEVDAEFFQSDMVKKPHPTRVPNKVHRTARRIVRNNAGREDRLFDLTSKGYKLPEPAVDEGSDMDVGSDHQPVLPASDDNLDSKLSNLWRQFLVDLTAKAPNPKSAVLPSYCKLSAEQRSKVHDRDHQNIKLSDYWNDCQWKISTEDEWCLIFDRLWPDKDKILCGSSVQNYKSAIYYIEWTTLTSNSDLPTVSAMRKELRKRFDSLFWVPHAQTDRIWHTKYLKGFQRSSGDDHLQPAPRILINWAADRRPSW